MQTLVLQETDFRRMQDFLLREAGIALSEQKKQLVWGRLSRRLTAAGCSDYASYVALITGGARPEETQIAIDLLTTNETHFFREAHHFELLREHAATASNSSTPLRVWSAACSSGEEVYTIAMVLAEVRGIGASWSVLGSDLSTRVLHKAQQGRYAMSRANEIPQALLQNYCLRGTGEYEGVFAMDKALQSHVEFRQINLNQTLPNTGMFDVIFLRNVMIYFDLPTKRQVVARLLRNLRPGGLFMIGHAETLQGVCETLTPAGTTAYRKSS